MRLSGENQATEYTKMIIIVAILFVITVFQAGCAQKYLQGSDYPLFYVILLHISKIQFKYIISCHFIPDDCGVNSNMKTAWRKDAVREHNWKRFYLANGYPFKDRRDIKFPTASDMNALYYDCDLENVALEIAKGCHNGDPDFDYIGSNNETFPHLKYELDFNFILSTVDKWWETAFKDGDLVDLTPSEENRPMIPFLQMSNGGTSKIGCALHECHVDDYQRDEHGEGYPYIEEYQYGEVNQHGSKSYVLFVCAYGDPHIKVGNPIYTDGPQCDSCKDRCLDGALCDTQIA